MRGTDLVILLVRKTSDRIFRKCPGGFDSHFPSPESDLKSKIVNLKKGDRYEN